MRLLPFVFLLLLGLVSSYGRPQVITTHTVLADLVAAIGGDRIDAKCLMPTNLDPHSYEPKPADIRLLAHADVVIINGLGLEPWAEKVIANSGFRGPVVKAANRAPRLLKTERGTDDEARDHVHPTDHYDPHAWHNPRNVQQYIVEIREALIQVSPQDADFFRTSAAQYQSDLKKLDDYAREQLATIPPPRRKLVTSHDALSYLADAYDLTIVPIAGTRPEQEPSARQLAQLISFIRKQQVRAVFFEATANPKLVELVAREAGVTVVGELYTDSLGPPNSSGATYLTMFRANVDTLVRALR